MSSFLFLAFCQTSGGSIAELAFRSVTLGFNHTVLNWRRRAQVLALHAALFPEAGCSEPWPGCRACSFAARVVHLCCWLCSCHWPLGVGGAGCEQSVCEGASVALRRGRRPSTRPPDWLSPHRAQEWSGALLLGHVRCLWAFENYWGWMESVAMVFTWLGWSTGALWASGVEPGDWMTGPHRLLSFNQECSGRSPCGI